MTAEWRHWGGDEPPRGSPEIVITGSGRGPAPPPRREGQVSGFLAGEGRLVLLAAEEEVALGVLVLGDEVLLPQGLEVVLGQHLVLAALRGRRMGSGVSSVMLFLLFSA